MLRKTFFLSCGLVVAIGSVALPSTARAQFGHHHSRSHLGLHQELAHREFHRQLYHDYAHQFPMSHREHFRLHQDLDHDRYHDALRHQRYHIVAPRASYYRGYSPVIVGRPGCGTVRRGVRLGYSPYGFSIHLGF
ncbi:MAG: hypothetical protein KatS3mg111_3507 [Pirellulaceae bacterium]|nr:MAG: hypothetical protein KatS3mg111_3507 [Pirellulaceae bacterium]